MSEIQDKERLLILFKLQTLIKQLIKMEQMNDRKLQNLIEDISIEFYDCLVFDEGIEVTIQNYKIVSEMISNLMPLVKNAKKDREQKLREYINK